MEFLRIHNKSIIPTIPNIYTQINDAIRESNHQNMVSIEEPTPDVYHVIFSNDNVIITVVIHEHGTNIYPTIIVNPTAGVMSPFIQFLITHTWYRNISIMNINFKTMIDDYVKLITSPCRYFNTPNNCDICSIDALFYAFINAQLDASCLIDYTKIQYNKIKKTTKLNVVVLFEKMLINKDYMYMEHNMNIMSILVNHYLYNMTIDNFNHYRGIYNQIAVLLIECRKQNILLNITIDIEKTLDDLGEIVQNEFHTHINKQIVVAKTLYKELHYFFENRDGVQHSHYINMNE
jgi:hypothetical protein